LATYCQQKKVVCDIGGQNGNHSQHDLAKFGCRLDGKVESLRILLFSGYLLDPVCFFSFSFSFFGVEISHHGDKIKPSAMRIF